jgi:hypothetical protein
MTYEESLGLSLHSPSIPLCISGFLPTLFPPIARAHDVAGPSGKDIMKLRHLRARVDRLAKISKGLSLEQLLWKKDPPPVLYVEKEEYLNALQDACRFIEKARVTLFLACERMEKEKAEREKRQQGG